MMSSAAVLFIFSVGLHAGAVLALAVLVVARRTSSTDSSAADRIDIEALEPRGNASAKHEGARARGISLASVGL